MVPCYKQVDDPTTSLTLVAKMSLDILLKKF